MVYREFEDEFANANTDGVDVETLERFAELVRADEREACAKVCYELPWKDMGHIPSNLAFAAAIRARSNT